MSESWNALCMTTWMCTIHYTSYQTFPDILHFQGILSFNKICNRQFKSHRHSYLKHPSPWPWQMQSCLVRAFENAILMVIFPACCFDLDTPSLSVQLAPHLPLKRVISLPRPFMAFFHLFLIHYHNINFHLWLTYSVNLYAACCIFKQDHFSTCFRVAPQSWKRHFSCDSHLQVVFWVFT